MPDPCARFKCGDDGIERTVCGFSCGSCAPGATGSTAVLRTPRTWTQESARRLSSRNSLTWQMTCARSVPRSPIATWMENPSSSARSRAAKRSGSSGRNSPLDVVRVQDAGAARPGGDQEAPLVGLPHAPGTTPSNSSSGPTGSNGAPNGSGSTTYVPRGTLGGPCRRPSGPVRPSHPGYSGISSSCRTGSLSRVPQAAQSSTFTRTFYLTTVLGCCCVTQWMPPPPAKSVRASTSVTVRRGNSRRKMPAAISSRGSSKPHRTTPPLQR